MADGCVLSMQICSTVLNPSFCGSPEVLPFDFLAFQPFHHSNPCLSPEAVDSQRPPYSAHSFRQSSTLCSMNRFPSSHDIPSYSHDLHSNAATTATIGNDTNSMPSDWKSHDQSQVYIDHQYYPSYQNDQPENTATSSSGRADYADQSQPTSDPISGRSKGTAPLNVSTSWADQPGPTGSAPLTQQTPVDSTFLVDQGETLDGISIWGEEFMENRYENQSTAVEPSQPIHPFHAFDPSSLSSASSTFRSSFGRQPLNPGSYAKPTSIPTPISSTSSSSSSSVNNQLSSSAHNQHVTNAPFVTAAPFEETTFSRYQQMFNEKNTPERPFIIASQANVLPPTRVTKDYMTGSPLMDLSVASSMFPSSSSTPVINTERRGSFQHYQRRPSIPDGKHLVHQASPALFSGHFITTPSETSGSDVPLNPYDHNPAPSGTSSTLSSSPSASSLPSSLGLTPKTSSTLPTVREGCLADQDVSSSWPTSNTIGPSSDLNLNINNPIKTIRSVQPGHWIHDSSLPYAPLTSGSPAHQQTPFGVTHPSSLSSSPSSFPTQMFLGPSSSSSSYSASTAPCRPTNNFISYSTGSQITPDDYRLLLLGQQRLQAHQKRLAPEAAESSSSSIPASSLAAIGSPFPLDHRCSPETYGPSLMTTVAATTEPQPFQVRPYPPTASLGLTNLSMMDASLPTDLPGETPRSGSFDQAREGSNQAFNWATTNSSGGKSGTYNETDLSWAAIKTAKGTPQEMGSDSEKGTTGKRKETNYSARRCSVSIDRKSSKKKITSGSSTASIAESGKDPKETEVCEQSDGRSDRSPAQGIKKVSLACHFCRGRKLRCDATRPTCAHCVKRGLSCTYDSVIRRRGPGKRKNGDKALGEGLDAEGGETDE